MKKNSRVRRWLAMILCMTLVLSSNVVSMAAEENGTEVQAITEEPVIEETEPAAADEPVPEDITETETLMTETSETVPTEEPTEEPVDTEVPTETVTEPETPEVPETPETPTQDETEEPVQEETPEETERNEVALQEWVQEVNGATVKVVAEKGVLPEEAVLSAVEITDEAEVEQLEKAAEEQAIEKKVAIENIIAYDIKFLVNSEEVQPNGNVQVTVDTPIIESGQEASVLHVDDSNMAEDMQGTVDEQGNVVFETPHFSKYVIVQEGDSEVEITIEHYNMNNEKIYADDVLTLPVGGKVNNYAKATNWNVESVVLDEQNLKEGEFAEIKVAKDTHIKVYYSPKEKEVSGATTFYDYTVKAGTDYRGTKYSINMPLNYDDYGGSNRNRMTAGVDEKNYEEFRSLAPHSNWQKQYGGEAYYHDNPYTGLVEGLDEKGDVIFSVPQPGFFESSDSSITFKKNWWETKGETRYLRKVYNKNEYVLKFKQLGDTYTLDRVEGNGESVKAGNDFFPLDSVKFDYEEEANTHNFYFGMRYDVDFKIGDYVGPLNYEFIGDDDLWVILDGKKVVIDLGGIHNALTGKVDLWKYILHERYTEEEKATLSTMEKQKEHKLTILYMERGAYQSNCNMKFTLPEATISEVTEVPMADLLLKKVNKSNEPLEGAKFALMDSEGNVIQTATSTETGSVKFSKLKEGTYTLQETQAPSGYIPSLETWVVKVEVNEEGTAVATLYLSDGETEYTDKSGGYYEIVNVTKQELIDSSMEYDKTVHVVDWDKRTYNIDITASSIAKQTITKDGTAENMGELKELFKKLQDTITKEVAIAATEIRDVIAPRFVILDDSGNPITKDYPGIENGITLKNGGMVHYDKDTGNQYIVWRDQTIPAKGKENNQWHKTIMVKAQEDYIGGNGVETNISPDSKICTGYGDAILPQPTVNVKVDLTVNNAGEKIFLGENVPTDAETLKKLFDESNYAKYNGVEAQDFVMEWYRDASCTNKITVEDMEKEYPTGKTEFYLKVTYDAGKPKADSNTNTNGNVNGTETNGQYLVTAVNSQDASKAYGIYKVEVVSGKIDITKEITKTGNINLDGAPIFTFKIEYRKPGVAENAEATETYYRTIGFGEGEKTKEAETLKNLPKGTYKVTELDTQKYKLKSVSDNQSTCSVKPDNSSITFTLGGSNVDERANTEWTHGKAKFVNEKEAPNTNTDTDAYVNRFVKNADGTYTVQQIRVPEKKEDSNN